MIYFILDNTSNHYWTHKSSKCRANDRNTKFRTSLTNSYTTNYNLNRFLSYSQNYQVPLYLELATSWKLSQLNTVRYLSTNNALCNKQHSSKIEAAVESIKEKEKEKLKEEIKAQQTQLNEVTPTTVTSTQATDVVQVPKKKPLMKRIWEELVHYYHGFRLLFIDISVCSKLLYQVLNGQSLTRREHRLLIRTTSDLFRLVPFSVFIIVPFMELLLPLAIKLFPGMLPSTFQTAKDEEDKIKRNLKVKLEMAKFLQKTLDDMTVQSNERKSVDAKEFSQFFCKIRNTGAPPSNEEIMKFSKLFEDEITLDSLSRQQLTALCRVLETTTIGTNNFLRFQLRMKLRSLAADDRMIRKEGIESLTLSELQSACRARGMRAYGLSEERLKYQLQEWINLSLNEKVPPSLLLLSRALMLPEHVPTTDKLKATISVLPETIVAQTKAAIGEREGKIDNKTKIEIIREEERKIKEEKEEQKEIEKDKLEKVSEVLVDKAPTITTEDIIAKPKFEKIISPEITKPIESKEGLSSKDIEVLGEALGTISKESKNLIVEKEEIKDLKEEIADYQEDVEELREVTTTKPEAIEVKESKAAKNLFKKVNSMISKLEQELEKEEKKIKESSMEDPEAKQEELIHVDELLKAVKNLQKVPDESTLKQIHTVLDKFDIDQDGHIRVEDMLKVRKLINK